MSESQETNIWKVPGYTPTMVAIAAACGQLRAEEEGDAPRAIRPVRRASATSAIAPA